MPWFASFPCSGHGAPPSRRWCFLVGLGWRRSVRESQFQQWVYLVGVYDAPAKRLSLHVYASGVEPDFDTGTLDVPWQATGALRIGRGTVNGAAAEHWRGGIDDVRVYTGALPAERLASIYRSYPAP